jgi:hypothetical protein
MDLITHGLAGVLVAQADFVQRIGRPAVMALVAGAVLPDVDVVAETYPRLPSPWTWLGLETPTAVIRGVVDLGGSNPMRLDHYLKPQQDGLFTTAGELEEVQAFLEFARFPWMTAGKEAEQTVLAYYDLRFGSVPHRHDFRLEVTLDSMGKVRQTRLNHRF